MISVEEHNAGEKEMNGHALALLRMMGLSEDRGGDRIRNTMCATGTGLAPFYGLRKDHKSDAGDGNGPRVRPLCGAKECSTKRTSYLLCQLLTPLRSVGFFFFPYGFFLLEKDIQDHGLAWKFSQDHDNPEIYNTKIQ